MTHALKNSMLKKLVSKNRNWELLIAFLLFILSWVYIIVRANTVFMVFDEITTKWAYMVSWNPFPYQGYIDANNHFLNSLLGGLFIRIFQSDAQWVVRLPNILAFPVFFWSAFGFRRFLRHRVNLLLFLILIVFSAYIIDYFMLARGYGLSMALMIWALSHTAMFFKNQRSRHFSIAILAWLLAAYANLTLIPFALVGVVYLSIYSWNHLHKAWLIISLTALIPLSFLVKYIFHLKEIGKLYLGNSEGFYNTTVRSLTGYLWGKEGIATDVVLTVAGLLIAFTLIYAISKTKSLFQSRMVFSLFFILSIVNILGQHWLLGVNYPEDRAALYLIVFLFGALAFSIDFWHDNKAAYPLIAIILIIFVMQINFTKSVAYPYFHFDKELLTKIQDTVKGIPPSTGNRNWLMDNEMSRQEDLPVRAFQLSDSPSDTLVDYLVTWPDIRPNIQQWYHPVYKDKISNIVLYERNKFLSRKKIIEQSHELEGTRPYFNFYKDTITAPLFIRCKGYIGNLDLYDKAIIVCTVTEIQKQQPYAYYPLSLVKSAPIGPKGRIKFDFTFAVNDYSSTDKVTVFLWNKKKALVNGDVQVSVYEITD